MGQGARRCQEAGGSGSTGLSAGIRSLRPAAHRLQGLETSLHLLASCPHWCHRGKCNTCSVYGAGAAGAQMVHPTGAYISIPDQKSLMGALSSVRGLGCGPRQLGRGSEVKTVLV